MEIQEARKLKWDLQSQILELLQDYEKKTYGKVKSLSIEHAYNMGTEAEIVSVHIEVHV